MNDQMASPAPITAWLDRLHNGDPEALNGLFPCVYAELRALARAQLRGERPGHTLTATALVHEAYLRMAERERLAPEDRRHFFAIAAQTMRRVLIDSARARKRKKRGGNRVDAPLEEELLVSNSVADDLLAIDDALERLAAANERAARVVECRFFAGLTLEETATTLGMSLKTVQRDWIVARAWLRKEIGPLL